MIMKTMKKIFCGAMAGALVLASFASCGGSESYEVNYDIDLSQKINLSVLMPNSGYDISVVNSDSNAQVIEELTGYHVTYSQLPASNASTQLNLQMINREKYHAMKLTSAQFADLVAQDVLLPLDDILDAYGPVLKQVISKESWDVVTVDGKIYGIPEKASSDNIENPILLRQDWINELLDKEAIDFAIPTNTTEFKTLLQAIKSEYNVTPLTFDCNQTLIYPISAAFGIYSEWQEYEIDGKTEVRFYMQAPQYKDYVDYMSDLYKEGLIASDVQDKDSAKSILEFGSGKAGALATSLWSVGSVVETMVSNKIITEAQSKAEDGVADKLLYLRSLDEDGKVYRTSGYTYITAIPFYMAENAGYAIDWMNSKVTDTDDNHIFREIVIGEEGVHWSYSEREGYRPLTEKFDEKNDASYYLTGSNELVYTKYWLARVRKIPEMYRAWEELMTDANEVGVYNIADALPPLSAYSTVRANIETYAQEQFFIMLKNGTGSYSTYLNKFLSDGGTQATNAISGWYLNK